ncbi:MAG: VWA domain-containing protein, partial [Acidimicrobiia bacterium]|nr:VWA domain-containing protein [Acidimicrobiia bacterium]
GAGAGGQGDEPEDLDARFEREEFEARLKEFRELVESEIRRRLVADRGVEAMARTLRKPLPEDVDFMHASRDEMQQLQHAIEPLTRALAARLAQRRKRKNRGHLDFRATVRHSLSYGGVPAEPKFKDPKPSKPEIMVVADISGSVASFARFTLQFVYAMAGQFSKVRSWVFIDGIDEVTRFFEESNEISEAVHRVNTEADVIWVDGHSDYGHALEVFYDRHLTEVTSKTSVILLGDARNNYHATQNWVLKELRQKARRVYWLNPEPRGYWDTGDSVVSEYGIYCDGVYECRNLRQLERFVAAVIEA